MSARPESAGVSRAFPMAGRTARLALLAAVAIGISVLVLLQPPLAQSLAYHSFADQRMWLGIPNFWNIASNLGFVLAGIYGLSVYSRFEGLLAPALKPAYFSVFLGAILIGAGSAYYHLLPGNAALTWDRLPMAITFMGLFTVLIGEYIDLGLARRLFWPLLLAGIASVLYWHASEQAGRGDLRPYILVQFLPMLLVPLILLLFRPGGLPVVPLWGMAGCYLLAKVFEYFDAALLQWVSISGHSLKHLAAALGLFLFAWAVRHKSRADMAPAG